MSSAYDLGSLYGRWRYTNAFIGNGDYNDYWRFTINSAGGIYPGFNLYMSGMSADADVWLLNSSGSVIASSTRGGSSSEYIGISGLSPGTYYARVYPYSGYTYYNLELTANYGGTSLGSAPSINRQDLLDGWSIPDFVGYGYDDYYKVSVDRTSTINLSLTGMSADADLRLLNSSGSVIASSSAGGSTSDYISNFTISSGTYYVQVDPFSSAETNYSLGARVIPQDYTGNSFSSSRYVGFLSSSDITFDEFVGAYDTDDYYRFDISNPSNFRLYIHDLSEGAYVYLYNSSGSQINSSYGSSSTNLYNTLAPGTYYARVSNGSSSYNNSTYHLHLNATTIPDGAGNTLTTARNIGSLGSTQTFNDFVGTSDTNDYYRFNLNSNSNVNVSLSGLTADANIEVLNSAGTVVASSTNGSSSSENLTRALGSGTYYLRVYPFGSINTIYNLSLGATVIPDNAGNTIGAARNIGALSSSQTFNDFVGSGDPNDYYRFSLNNASNVTLNLSGLSANADIALLNSSGTVVASSINTGTTAETLTRSLNEGTYYVWVYPFSTTDNTNYNLSILSVIPDNAGNTLTTARNIGTLSSTQTFTDFVGTSDTNDYYRFNVTTPSSFSLGLNNLTANADVQLLNSSGSVVASSTASGSNPESMSSILNPGTYYVRIYPVGSDSTGYNLSFGATVFDGAGNTLTAARNIGTLTTAQSFIDFVGTSDTNDYYRFSLNNTSNLRLTLNNMTANADVQLLNDSGSLIASSTVSGTVAESISSNLNSGIYYVRVYPAAGNDTNYSLNLSARFI